MTHTGESVLEADALEDVLATALRRVDRREALGEAQVAVLEAAVNIVRAGRPQLAQLPLERTELLREALGAVRAATVATGVALTYAHQTSRQLS
ncbi:hypothetical protein [Streptomyces sp. NBC_00203]|uniref:hypothetical protein n=1 Tax=Streptomyces sp. NBC_00203 TaxID=2975680 RepID=UPI0032502931